MLTTAINFFFFNLKGLPKEVYMKKLKLTGKILPIIFFIFLFVINIFPQVEIKERIEINPGIQTMNPLLSGCTFGNCTYYDCDSSEIYIRFTPPSIEPGESTIMNYGLWTAYTNIMRKIMTYSRRQ